MFLARAVIAASAALIARVALASDDDEPASIKVELGESHEILPHWVGYNGNLTSLDQPWNTPGLAEATKELRPGNLRYPAGSLGNIWDWDAGRPFRDSGPTPATPATPGLGEIDYDRTIAWTRAMANTPRTYTLDNLAAGQKKVGFEPVYMLNVVHYEPAEQIEHLKHARALGLPVTYVELGNELYFGPGADRYVTDKFPTPEAYATAANEWARAIKAEFPNALVAAVGSSGGEPRHSERRRTWNAKVAPLLDPSVIDAVTVHKYVGHDLDGIVEGNDMEAVGGVANKPGNNRIAPPEWQAAVHDLLQTEAGVAYMLSRPRAAWDKFSASQELPADMPIWLTEFNISDHNGAVRNTWSHGLFIAAYLDAYLADGRVQLVDFHNLIGGNLFPALWGDDDFQNLALDAAKGLRPTRRWEPTAPGLVMSLFGRAMHGRDTATALDLPGIPSITDKAGNAYPAAFAWHFSSRDGSQSPTAIVVNLSPKPVTLDFSTIDLAGTVTTLSAAPHTFVARPDAVTRTTAALAADPTFPAYSVSLIAGE